MTITALPDSAAHLINSAQVLTTPVSLVKELVDNALDAKATSVDVVISQNTLDKIEVKDNGYGISLEDLNVLGKRGHTSKLRSFEELRFIGGDTLGFRGEALASALQLGNVVVTTKTDGESVATVVKLLTDGGIRESSRKSHPTGTTVSVTSFMYELPVRKKIFEKESVKTLAKIRQLMLAFALARPSIRFSLKVLKASKYSWTFSPRSNDGIKEAVSQVIGRDTSNQCIEMGFAFSESRLKATTDSVTDEVPKPNSTLTGDHLDSDLFTLEAFIPKPGFDPLKIGKGQYISIDSRPVSHDKGTIKKIVTIFKTFIRGSNNSENIKSPFMRINLRCPRTSYDPNIEPAKDDVLFGNESLIIESVNRFFEEFYGQHTIIAKTAMASSLINIAVNSDLLLASKPIAPPPITEIAARRIYDKPPGDCERNLMLSPSDKSQEIINSLSQSQPELEIDESAGCQRRKWGFDMLNDSAEDMEASENQYSFTQRPHGQIQARTNNESSENIGDSSLNPWVIAKMTAPSSRNSEPPRNLHHRLRPNILIDSTFNTRKGTTPVELQALKRSRSNIQTEVVLLQQIVPEVSSYLQESTNHEEPGDFEPARKGSFMKAKDLPDRLLMSSPPSAYFPKHNFNTISTSKGTHRGHTQPFASPLTFKSVNSTRDGLQQRIRPRNLQQSVTNDARQGAYQEPNSDSDLTWTMDFEHRKEEATRHLYDKIKNERSAKIPNSLFPKPRSSPHKDLYNAAVTKIDTDQYGSHSNSSGRVKVDFKTLLPDNDPRAYPMRRKSSMALQIGKTGSPLVNLRVKSTRLPLETVWHDPKLHQLLQISAANIATIRKFTLFLSNSEEYVRHGHRSPGLVADAKDTALIIKKVMRTVETWSEKPENYDENWQNIQIALKELGNLRNVELPQMI